MNPMQGAPMPINPMKGAPMPMGPMQGAPMSMGPMQGAPMSMNSKPMVPMQGVLMQGVPMQGAPMTMAPMLMGSMIMTPWAMSMMQANPMGANKKQSMIIMREPEMNPDLLEPPFRHANTVDVKLNLFQIKGSETTKADGQNQIRSARTSMRSSDLPYFSANPAQQAVNQGIQTSLQGLGRSNVFSDLKEAFKAITDEIFINHDYNKSGFLDTREIYPAVNEVYISKNLNPPTYPQVLMIMELFDENKDGLIDKDEFRKICAKISQIS